MLILELDPKDVIVNAESRTRRAEPDEKKVTSFAHSMLERSEAGQTHQILPGVVRPAEDEGKYLLEDGEHRLKAVEYLNSSLPKGAEPFKFLATVSRDDDAQAILTSVEANLTRADLNLFDKAVGLQRLVDLGMTQEQIAQRLNMKPSTVSDTLTAGKLPIKYQQTALKKLTEEATIVLARVPVDMRDDILEASIAYHEQVEAIGTAAEEAAAAEEEDEQEEEAPKAKKATKSAPKSAAVARKGKGKSGKVSAETVKRVARQKGAMKDKSGRRSSKDIQTFLEAFFGPNVTESIPQPARDLAEYLDIYIDGDRGDGWMKQKMLECCRDRYGATQAA